MLVLLVNMVEQKVMKQIFLRAFPTQALTARDRRRYNTASALEVAAFIPDEEAAVAMNPRAIVVRVRGLAGGLKIINEFNAACDPLHFVLLFPRGELGSSCFFYPCVYFIAM
jgi:hypothetical protein